ncbi:unnamed protein product [Durusdinium trenchii]|uniref:Uncharacterized protein n=1 Tax=Durusdinium trenchii TaxID=1381693 RepID=A0ABP0RL92_9DINO
MLSRFPRPYSAAMAAFSSVLPKQQSGTQPAWEFDDITQTTRTSQPRRGRGQHYVSHEEPTTGAEHAPSPPTESCAPLDATAGHSPCAVRCPLSSREVHEAKGDGAEADVPDSDGPVCIPGCVALRIDQNEDQKEENEEVPDTHLAQTETSLGAIRVLKPANHHQAADDSGYSIVLQQVGEDILGDEGDQDVHKHGRLSPIPESRGASQSMDDRTGSKTSRIEDSKRSVGGLFKSRGSPGLQTKSSWTRETSSYTVSQTLQTKTGLVNVLEAVEPSMQVYLEEHCADGPSTMGRQVILWKTLGSFLFLMPTLSFGVMLLPFAPVEAGFHQNWVFNYLAHPILNYITARAYLELGLRRPLEPSEKHRVNWIVRCFPLVDTVVCLSAHYIAHMFGMYPLPFIVSTVCLPSMWISMMLASYFVPRELMTPTVRIYMRFASFELLFWGVQFVILMLWLLVFPTLPVAFQLMSSIAVTGMLSGAGWIMGKIGHNYLGVPEYITEEAKVIILFLAFLFSAALLSSAKNGLVLSVIFILDAGKAVAIALKMCHQLLATFRHAKVESTSSSWKSWFEQCCQPCPQWRTLPSLIREKWTLTCCLRERLREILADFEGMTIESLQQAEITVADARLLNQLAQHAKIYAFVMV